MNGILFAKYTKIGKDANIIIKHFPYFFIEIVKIKVVGYRRPTSAVLDNLTFLFNIEFLDTVCMIVK